MNYSKNTLLENFLASSPVPFTNTPEWRDWQEKCNVLLGPDSVSTLVDILKYGPEAIHYATMMALRMYGMGTSQTGEGEGAVYGIYSADKKLIEQFTPLECPLPPMSIEEAEKRGLFEEKWRKPLPGETPEE